MKPVEPTKREGMRLVVYAKTQPEYQPLPALVGDEGTVLVEWEPTEEERAILFSGGRIRLWLLNAVDEKKRLRTPMKIEVIEPECGYSDDVGQEESAGNKL